MTLLPPSVADLFHLPGTGPYFVAHSIGCQPRSTAERIARDLLGPWAATGARSWDHWLPAIQHFRTGIAQVLDTDASLVCPQPSVSTGFARWLGALPPPDESRCDILVAPSSFPSLGFVAQGAERLGYRLRYLPDDADVADPATWRAAINDQTTFALAMLVTSNSGKIAPVVEIVEAAQRHGARVCLDVAQASGIIPITMTEWGVHAIVGSCVKWLSGGPGAGYIALRSDDVPLLDVIDKSWWGHEAPFEMNIRDFRPAPDATRLWGGTPDVAPFVIASAGIDTILGIGIAAIRAHNRTLQAYFRANLDRPDWRWPGDNVGGGLCIDVGVDRATLEPALKEAGIAVDFRGSIMRVSFAAWNSIDDVNRLVTVLR